MERDWIDSLRERFSDRKAPPPEGLFEEIQARLPRPAGQRARRAVPMWMRAATAAAACLAAAVLLIIGWPGGDDGTDGGTGPACIAGEGSAPAGAGKPGAAETAGDVDAAAGNVAAIAALARPRAASAMASGTTDGVEEPGETGAQERDAGWPEPEERADGPSTGQTGDGDGGDRKGQGGVVRPARPSSDQHRARPTGIGRGATGGRRSRGAGMGVSVYGAGMTFGGASATASGSAGSQMMKVAHSDTDEPMMLLAAGASTSSDTEVNVNHRFPLKVGATVRFMLTDRLGLETGMLYTHHQSDIMSGDEWGGYKTVQKLNYIGIPLSVGYDIWRNRYVSVYAKGGATVEFCVSGNATTDYIVVNTVTETTSESLREKRPQWSVNVTPGIQYNFLDVLGIFAEPGVSLYFDNNSGVSTVYKDRKFNFNLNVGLRLTPFRK